MFQCIPLPGKESDRQPVTKAMQMLGGRDLTSPKE